MALQECRLYGAEILILKFCFGHHAVADDGQVSGILFRVISDVLERPLATDCNWPIPTTSNIYVPSPEPRRIEGLN